jgi:hypothetical protein
MISINELESHLIGLSHGGTLNKVRNKYYLYNRVANNVLSKIKPLESIRVSQLVVATDNYDYTLPSDFYSLIGIYPQGERNWSEEGERNTIEDFDRLKKIDDRKFSIEALNGTKRVRIDWDTRPAKVLHAMESFDGNGTWVASGTTTNVLTDTIYKVAGGGSVRFDIGASGDGIQNTTMASVDLTTEDEIADLYLSFYIKDSTELAKLTSVSARWGNDVTTAYWQGVAQTANADGTAFHIGWNTVKIPWSTATETGTVSPSAIDSVRVTFASTGTLNDVRVDNLFFSIGYAFDIKYYSKYFFQTASGTYINQPTTDTDLCILDNDALNIYIYECLDEMAHQVEGEDSRFDMEQARKKLYGDNSASDYAGRVGLYAMYRANYPTQEKKIISSYGMKPKWYRT